TDASHVDTLAPILRPSGDATVRGCAPVDVIRMSDVPGGASGGDGSQVPDSQGIAASVRVPARQCGERERMGIEPTRDLSPGPSLVLKTRGGTSRPNAPFSVRRRMDATISDGTPIFQGRGLHRGLNSRACYHVRKRRIASRNVPCALPMRCQIVTVRC